jgi:hypothetical protein
MARIQLHHSMQEALFKMSEGNPGALTVMIKILQEAPNIDKLDNGFSTIIGFDLLGLYGSEIWMFYKDVCKESIVHTIAAIRGWQLGLLTELEVRNGNFVPEVLTKIIEEKFSSPQTSKNSPPS